MMKLVRKFCIVCLSVLLSILLAGSGLQGAVLCHGEDGHIAIEAADSICCSKISDCSSQVCSADSVEKELSSNHDCGACTDIPISVGFATVVKKLCRSNPALPASGIIAFANVYIPGFSEYQLVSEPFALSRFFTPLRSIILLI
jgi:hypothetical protein